MFELHTDSLDDIEESHRAFYEPDPDNDGGFRLKVAGIDKLRNSKRNEKELRLAVERKNRELSARIRELEGKPPAKPESEMTPRERFFAQAEKRLSGLDGDARKAELAKLETEMEPLIAAEIAEIETKHRTEYESLEQSIRAATIEQSAQRIVADLARDGSAPLLLPLVTARLGCEKRGDEWAVFVTDAEGKPTAASVDMLKDELRASPALAPIVRGVTESEAAAHARRVEAAISPPKTP